MIENLLYFTPQLLLATLALVLMLQTSFMRAARVSQSICMLGLIATVVATISLAPAQGVAVTSLIHIQPASNFFILLVLASALSTVLLQFKYGEGSREVQDEFYILTTLATLGACILVTAAHAATLLLGLELMSLSILAMLAYQRDRQSSLEGAIKFLILSGAATAFFLLGLAFLYATSGSLTFPALFQVAIPTAETQLFSKTGLFLLLIGLCFKLSLMPFHWWTPDVYQGAPVNSTLFLATVSKAAAFAILLRLLTIMPDQASSLLAAILGGVAILSMIGGNLLALQQQNLKRLFAYSAIAHMGYILVAAILAIRVNDKLALEGSSYYLLAYVLASIAIFSTLTLLSDKNSDCEYMDDIRGLFWRHPYLATVLILATLSMAGMPLTVGFIGKFYLLSVAVEHSAWWLISAMILGSVIGLFYYLRVIICLFNQTEEEARSFHRYRSVWLGLVTLCILVFGILPDQLGAQIAALFS